MGFCGCLFGETAKVGRIRMEMEEF